MSSPTKSVRTKLKKFSKPSNSHVLQITDKTSYVTRIVMGQVNDKKKMSYAPFQIFVLGAHWRMFNLNVN